MGRELRRSYLIKRTFQAKLMLRLALMILVTSLMVALIFVGSRYYVAVKMGNPSHFDVLDELGSLFFEVLVYWLTGYLLLFFYFALRFSHEIAGPLYRFEKAFLGIAEDGDLGTRIRLREEDDREFHHLAGLFNQAVDRVKTAFDNVRAAAGDLRQLEQEPDPAAVKEGVSRARQSLDEALEALAGPPLPAGPEPAGEPERPASPDPYFE
ncbi:MAG: hypothetical protein HY814_06530 [Candidatus Riflebacteria bacterium]|nr:hypothetical protein [Candidatus Riflebacteria bacterium]